MSSVVRLRHLAQINPGTPAFDALRNDDELTFLPMEAVWPGSRLDISQRRTKKAVSTGYTRFQDGDILVPKITPTFEAGRAVLIQGLHGGVGAGTTELHVVRPGKEIDPRFLLYVVNTHRFLKLGEAEMYGVAGQQRVPDDFLRDLPVSLPTLETQCRIADFLDAETARIDRIHDLRTQQQDVINEAAFCRVYDAVRGVHVEGGRKKSGLNWLGDVPANWRVGAVSHYFEVELGKMLNPERTQGPRLRPYLRVANVQWDRIDTTDLAFMDFPSEEQYRYRLRAGDLLVNEGGSWPGRAAVWNDEMPEMYYQKALHRIRARGEELPRWLYYCLVTAERLKVFQVQGNTSTMTHLTREQLRPQRFPFPDVPTQKCLVSELDRAVNCDAEMQRLLTQQLNLLSERRRALITAAVTGEFDVTTASGRNVTEGVSA
ncbi:restriction endonuclease subunit S [Streptomyces chumphonensis]|uniref:restriction endonuclease subunit S n=1 Tax=Streptomyces chumphonensis TaxID=1214925 RepID=UPI003D74F598